MPEDSIPLVQQAEAYHRDSYILIHNDKTESVIALTRRYVAEPISEVTDFPAFLDATADMIKNARVIVALGDSRTANFSNWPRILATSHLRATNVVVVNLADWARCSEEHVAVLEFYLAWLREHDAAGISVVLIAGLTDMHSKLEYYTEFAENNASTFASETEERLSTGSYSAELAELNEDVPTEWDIAYRWIARRILAIVRVLERLCRDAEAQFFAILEPNSYADCSPGYERALRRAYETQTDGVMPFEAWCHERLYSLDPSAFHARDLRAILDQTRRSWRVGGDRIRHGRYIDWSALFFDIDECCFDPHFDAVHYNERGKEMIAGAVFDLLGGG
jgi:hypothetical protein